MHNKRVMKDTKNISFSQCILDKVLRLDLRLIQNLHGIELLSV